MKSLAIEREYGTGGLLIGKEIAKINGIPFYDEQGIILEAEKKGCKLTLLKEYEQTKKESILYNIAMIANQYETHKIHTDNLIGELFQEIKETVIEICNKGPAVFVDGAIGGILDGSEDLIKVFICGNDKEKEYYLHQCKVVSMQDDMQELMKGKDCQRSDYYRILTNKEWKNHCNYDLIYDVSKILKDDIIDQLNECME